MPIHSFPVQSDSAPLDAYSRIERKRGFITVEELAAELQVSSRSLYRLIKRGVLPSIRLGKTIRLEPVTTAKWLRDRASIAA